MLFQDQGKLPDANVLKTKNDKKGNCSNCEYLWCKILEPQGSREESNLDQFVVELLTTFDGGNTTDSSYFFTTSVLSGMLFGSVELRSLYMYPPPPVRQATSIFWKISELPDNSFLNYQIIQYYQLCV